MQEVEKRVSSRRRMMLFFILICVFVVVILTCGFIIPFTSRYLSEKNEKNRAVLFRTVRKGASHEASS